MSSDTDTVHIFKLSLETGDGTTGVTRNRIDGQRRTKQPNPYEEDEGRLHTGSTRRYSVAGGKGSNESFIDNKRDAGMR